MFVYSPAPAHARHQPADEWEKRAQHLFDLSQESCQEQAALETPRGGMDPAVPVVWLVPVCAGVGFLESSVVRDKVPGVAMVWSLVPHNSQHILHPTPQQRNVSITASVLFLFKTA